MANKTTMTDEARKEKNKYARKWRKENPDKVQAAQARYWNRKAEAAARESEDREG